MNRVAVIRRANFNAAHKLWNDQWDSEKTRLFSGYVLMEQYHGHNYILEVKYGRDRFGNRICDRFEDIKEIIKMKWRNGLTIRI